MANGTSGTKRAAAAQPTAQPTAQPIPQPVPTPQTEPELPKQAQKAPATNGFSAFANLAPDQQAAAINKALVTTVPDHLNNDSDLQRLLYSQKIVGLPDVVSESQLDKLPGKTYYRTVNNVYDDKNDIGYSAPDIATQVMKGRQTYVANGSRAVYGEGLYFANSRSDSEWYGKTRGDISKTAVIKAKVKPSAKIISEQAALSGANSEIRRGTKLGAALSKASDKRALYAMAKGYQALDNGMGYLSIIDRSCLVISDKITAKS